METKQEIEAANGAPYPQFEAFPSDRDFGAHTYPPFPHVDLFLQVNTFAPARS
jgi:hypothetical protein